MRGYGIASDIGVLGPDDGGPESLLHEGGSLGSTIGLGSPDRLSAISALAFEIAEMTMTADGVPDAEDWEIAKLLYESGED